MKHRRGFFVLETRFEKYFSPVKEGNTIMKDDDSTITGMDVDITWRFKKIKDIKKTKEVVDKPKKK